LWPFGTAQAREKERSPEAATPAALPSAAAPPKVSPEDLYKGVLKKSSGASTPTTPPAPPLPQPAAPAARAPPARAPSPSAFAHTEDPTPATWHNKGAAAAAAAVPTSEFTGNPIYAAVSAAAAKAKAAAVAEPAPPSAPSTAWTGGGDENKANAHTNVNKVNVPADGLVRTVFKLAKVGSPPCPYSPVTRRRRPDNAALLVLPCCVRVSRLD
jgi:hypothetical protein